MGWNKQTHRKGIVCIPDLHQDEVLFERAKRAEEEGYFPILMGDIVDSFDKHPDPPGYLRRVLEWAVSVGAVILLGNHDAHYMFMSWMGPYSGFQKKYQFQLSEIYNEFKSHFKVAHIEDNKIFVHGGIGTWLLASLRLKYGIEDPEDVVSFLNTFPVEIALVGAGGGGTGIDGPLWLRPSGYRMPVFTGYTQIVGHTHLKGRVRMRHNMICIDTGELFFIEK